MDNAMIGGLVTITAAVLVTVFLRHVDAEWYAFSLALLLWIIGIVFIIASNLGSEGIATKV